MASMAAKYLIYLFAIFAAYNLFLWPAFTTFKRILKKKTTDQFSGVPYVMTLLSCLLSAWYGMLFVSPDNIDLIMANGAGVLLELLYVMIFVTFARNIKDKAKILGLFTFVLAVFSFVFLVSVYALHGSNSRRLFCGSVAAISTILMYASPLSIMGTVVKTKSVEAMPYSLSFSVFFTGTLWMVYGILGHDPFVAVPNGFGCALGLLQLILHFYYKVREIKNQFQPSADDTVELRQANGVEGV